VIELIDIIEKIANGLDIDIERLFHFEGKSIAISAYISKY
jgi:hypothetical protein